MDRDPVDLYADPTTPSSGAAPTSIGNRTIRCGSPLAFGLGHYRRARKASSTAAIAYSTAAPWMAGSGGAAGSNNTKQGNNAAYAQCATGGVGGVLALRYILPA